MATLKRKTNNGYEPLPAMVVRKTNAENGNGIGTCSTSSGTALEVTLANYELVQNGFIAVTFENDVPANATLNVNGKGAKPIYYKGAAIDADVIKADETVTFAYDGTNYVVTSLGGGGGSETIPEFAIITLETEEFLADRLIGATITVTDDDTSETIYTGTWNGDDILVEIPDGTNYTVTVGSVTGFTTPSPVSYSAIAYYQRQITMVYDDVESVDMGLQSGLRWCTHNVGSSTPEGYGSYFSWGNIQPNSSAAYFTQSNYNSTTGSALSGNLPTNSTYDAARAIMGEPWRVPTMAEQLELWDASSITNVTVGGVVCLKFTSKINGKYIILPTSGCLYDGDSSLVGRQMRCWTGSLIEATKANFLFNERQTNGQPRYFGTTIRPVR